MGHEVNSMIEIFNTPHQNRGMPNEVQEIIILGKQKVIQYPQSQPINIVKPKRKHRSDPEGRRPQSLKNEGEKRNFLTGENGKLKRLLAMMFGY